MHRRCGAGACAALARRLRGRSRLRAAASARRAGLYARAAGQGHRIRGHAGRTGAALRARPRPAGPMVDAVSLQAAQCAGRARARQQCGRAGGAGGAARRARERARAARRAVSPGRRRLHRHPPAAADRAGRRSTTPRSRRPSTCSPPSSTCPIRPTCSAASGARSRTLEAQADAQRFQLEATYLTLTSNLAGAAVQEASLRGQIAATQQIIKIERDVLGLLREQRKAGQIAELDVVAQEAALAQVEQTLPPLQKAAGAAARPAGGARRRLPERQDCWRNSSSPRCGCRATCR